MKKTITILLLVLFAISWQTRAQFNESFEGATFPPANWTVINDGDANTWESGSVAHTGSSAAKIHYSSDAHDDWLITPAITVVAGSTDRISFWAKNYSASWIDEFNVMLSTTGTAKTDFTVTLDSNVGPLDTYTLYEYNLSAYVGQTVYVAIQAISTNQLNLYVDDVVNDALPTCPPPYDLTASNVRSTHADLSWTAGGSETAWNIEYGPAGFTQGSGTTVAVSSNPFSLTGLTSGTIYDYYVQADCGGGDASTWAGPYTFTTPPACGETFYDDGGAAGQYSPNLNQTVTIYPDNAGDMVTVTFAGFDMEQSWDGVMIYDGPDTNAPLIDSGSTYGHVTCPNGAWTGSPSDMYSADGHSFTSTDTTGALTFVFTSDGSTEGNGWEAVVTCAPAPTCPAPSDLAADNITLDSADLSWTENGSATTWNVEFGPAGFTPGQGNLVNTTSNPFNVTGLTSGTSYDFYVQSDCGGGDVSTWEGPYSFITVCEAVNTFPYTEDFENGGDIPTCWENDTTDAGGDWIFVTSSGHCATADHTSGSGYYALLDDYNVYSTNSPFNLISPTFDLSANSYVLKYWYWIGSSAAANPIHVDISTDGGVNWTEDVYVHDLSIQTTWTENTIDLTSYNTANVVIRFRGESIYGSGTDNSGIDDVSIEEANSVNELTNVTGIYPNPTTGEFVIKSHDLNDGKVFVYTMTGKEIYHGTIDSDAYTVNLRHVNKGVYFVKVTSNDKSYVSKLIIK